MDKSWDILIQTTPKFLLRNGPDGRWLSAVLFYAFCCQKTGLGIQDKYFLYRFQISGWRCSHYFFDDPGNVLESDLFVEKRGHRDFVGGVEGDSFRACGLGGF